MTVRSFDPMAQAVARARAAREQAVAAHREERADGPPDHDRIAAAAGQESGREARVRRLALAAKQRRQEAREVVAQLEDQAVALAHRAAFGEAEVQDVVRALRERDEARLQLEAADLVAREIGQDTVLRGRR